MVSKYHLDISIIVHFKQNSNRGVPNSFPPICQWDIAEIYVICYKDELEEYGSV